MIFYRQLFWRVTYTLWLVVLGLFLIFVLIGLTIQDKSLLYLIAKTPNLIYQHLIFVVAIAVLTTVGRMVLRGEILCMIISGLSFRRMISIVTLATMSFYIFCTLFNETLGVKWAIEARQMTQETRTPLDVWLMKDRSAVRLGRLDTDGTVHNVEHFEYIDNTANRYVKVEKMNWHPKSKSWLEQGVRLQEVTPQGVREHRVDHRLWQHKLNATVFRLLAHSPEHLPIRRLIKFEQVHDSAYIDLTHKYRNYLWRLAALPLWIVITTVMSCFIVISFSRNRKVGRDIIVGILIVFVVDVSTRMLLGISTLLLWHPLYVIIPPLALMALYTIYFSKKI